MKVLAVVVLALAARLVFVAVGPGWELESIPGGDPLEFHEIAVSIADGQGFSRPWPGGGPDAGAIRPTAIRAPLWPLLLAALYRGIGVDPTAGRLLLCVIDAVTCSLVLVLGRRLVSLRVGVVAGLVTALSPALWVSTVSLMSEAVFTFLLVANVLAVARWADEPSSRRAAVAGLAIGSATLARPNGLVVGAVVASWVLVVAWRRTGRASALRAMAALAAGAAIIVGPWIAYAAAHYGRPVPVTSMGGAVVGGTYRSSMLDTTRPDWGGWDVVHVLDVLGRSEDEAAFDGALQRDARSWVREHPVGALRLVGLRMLRYLDLYWRLDDRVVTETPTRWRTFNAVVVVTWWITALAAYVGLVRAARAGALRRFGPSVLVVLSLAASGFFLVAATRYRAPAEPFVAILAAVGLVGAGQVRRATT